MVVGVWEDRRMNFEKKTAFLALLSSTFFSEFRKTIAPRRGPEGKRSGFCKSTKREKVLWNSMSPTSS